MTVLVTGATGFVGRHLVEALCADGESVRILTRSERAGDAFAASGVEIVHGDLHDAQLVERAAAGCRYVYHLAGRMIEPQAPKEVFYRANVDATRNVARACLTASVERMVHVSTAGVYGLITRPPVDEDSPVNPSSAYRDSKWRAEQLLRGLHETEGLPVVIARVAGVLGPRSFTMLNLVRAIGSGHFRIIGTGGNHEHLGYVSDTVDALRLCAETPNVEGRCYLIASEEAITVTELVDAIAAELGTRRSPRHVPAAPYRMYNALSELTYRGLGRELPGVHRYALFLGDKVLDITKAKRDLGYRPAISIREGIHRLIVWYRENGYL
jgi:nucleoside-diphosphate-sugar epimerase